MHQHRYQAIDPLVLLKAAGNDIESFRHLSQTFLRIAPPMLERLEQAVLAGDCVKAAHESHALKGTTVLIGAVRLTSLVQDVETRSRAGDSVAITGPLAEIEREFALVVQEVCTSIIQTETVDTAVAPTQTRTAP